MCINVRLKRFPIKKMFAVGKKEVLRVLSVCLTLLILHAMCIRRFILSSAACPTAQYFSTLSHKRHDFREGGGGEDVTEPKMCFDFLYKVCLKNFSF
jgi:hypothetical protein